jgi:hypothetical protein
VKAVIKQNNSPLSSVKFNEGAALNLAESLNLRWQDLCSRHLPVTIKNSIWRYSRRRSPHDAEQGWKLHISATILTASTVLETIASFLESEEAYYKAPVSLNELKRINSGFHYDYSQIGKFITIYPQTDAQAVYFADRLHKLTFQIPSPSVPYDLRYKAGSCVYYRYGAFQINEIKNSDGTSKLAIRDFQGNLIPDVRDGEKNCPDWVSNPFPAAEKKTAGNSPLKNFRIFRALAQRGKGGVYMGVDLSSPEPRLCLIKEGRKNGEVNWDGRDGYWRIEHEEFVLETLQKNGINVPQIYSSFASENNYYLVTEFIAGENLHHFLRKKKRRLSISKAIVYSLRIAEIMAQIHKAGWLWRDCKPTNLIVTKKGDLRALDFEGACPINQPDPVIWTTLTVKSSGLYDDFFVKSVMTADLYALGAVIYLLFEGELPVVTENSIPKILRRNAPLEIKQLISELLDPQTAQTYKAQTVTQKLKKILNSIKK